jgi:excisionase family DNA binding protein
MEYSLEIPPELKRQADFIADRIREELRTDRLDGIVEDANGLAKLLGVSKATIERMTRAGLIPSFLIGDLRRFEVQRVLKHLMARDSVDKANAPQGSNTQ